MSKPKIGAKAILTDIRSGMDDAALMLKYSLSPQGIQSIFKKLIAARALTQAELDRRSSFHENAVNLAWKCPACGKPQPREFDECPDCGIIIAKYVKQQEEKREREIEGQLQQEKEKAEEKDKKAEETTTTQPSFCHKCGQKLMQESKFCSGCGSQITAHSGDDTGADGEGPKPDSKPKWKGGWNALGGGLFTGILVYYFGWHNMSTMEGILFCFVGLVGWTVILIIFRAARKSSSQSTS